MPTSSRPFLALFAICAGFVPARTAFAAPAEASSNIPWKVHQTAHAIYPPRLVRDGIKHGEAVVRVSVSANGELLDALVTACTHRDFGDEALRTVQRWRFEAARERNEPIGVVADITFTFVVNGPVAVEKRAPSPHDPRASAAEGFAYQAVSLQHLDGIPTPTQLVPPLYPQAWIERGIVGSATVEFYIDETGRARIPLVTATDHPLLGATAAAAVAQWRFAPPRSQGRPVLTRAEQLFTFSPAQK